MRHKTHGTVNTGLILDAKPKTIYTVQYWAETKGAWVSLKLPISAGDYDMFTCYPSEFVDLKVAETEMMKIPYEGKYRILELKQVKVVQLSTREVFKGASEDEDESDPDDSSA